MSTATQTYTAIAAQRRRDELILTHLPLVRHVLGRLLERVPAGADVENLEAAGVLGLVEAASNFDPGRGVQFKTFAYPRIRGAVLDELRRNSPLPQQMLERIGRIQDAYARLPHPVSPEALAEATGLNLDEVADCLSAIRLTRMASMDSAEEPLLHRIDRQPSPDAAIEDAETKRLLAEAITLLPERERQVVTLYYLEDLRLKEIGKLMNLSESRVSRLLSATLFQLGEYLRSHGR